MGKKNGNKTNGAKHQPPYQTRQQPPGEVRKGYKDEVPPFFGLVDNPSGPSSPQPARQTPVDAPTDSPKEEK